MPSPDPYELEAQAFIRSLQSATTSHHKLSATPRQLIPESQRRTIGSLLRVLASWSPVAQRMHPAEHLPDFIVSGYENLYIKAYGSDSAFIGDPTAMEHKSTPLVTRSDQPTQSNPSTNGQKKKLSASRKNTIKDQRAYDLKSKYDRKLRKVFRDLRDELRGSTLPAQTKCTHCRIIGEYSWNFCPTCGREMRSST